MGGSIDLKLMHIFLVWRWAAAAAAAAELYNIYCIEILIIIIIIEVDYMAQPSLTWT